MTAPLRVREIAPGESLRPFIDLVWKVNARDPNWVPPLRISLKTLLDRNKHPFHRHADVAYFLAERGGEPVGRISAHVNHLYNEYHGEKTGFFGFFECVDDAEVAGALVETAAEWLRARGQERMRGPMNFSTNEEMGVLVDGFDTPPNIMMTHNPPYYDRLLTATGLAKRMDALAYWIGNPHPPKRLEEGVERLARRHGATIRPADLKRFRDEVSIVRDIYNAAWQRNWGFVPMTDAEFEFMAKELRPVVDPDLCLIAEVAGRPVGFAITIPDLNQALKHLPDGRLFPFGLFRLLWERRKITNLRVVTLGLIPGYQYQGLGAAFYLRTFQAGALKGYKTAEASWILEDNWEMRRALEKMGAYVYKTYRIYDKPLEAGNGSPKS
ncbi:MAG TPA: hypothetical protein VFX98_05445 [Longimicrobiaceae bacterium]|nr:hypothetical protein [Longimicrobiaceae bacterium]